MREVAVEPVAGIAVVLGHVDDPGPRVDRARLVLEAAHRLDRDRIDRRGRREPELEHVAVGLLEPVSVPLRISDELTSWPDAVSNSDVVTPPWATRS
jgi:hypothetical protein